MGVLGWAAAVASMIAATFFQPLCAGERGLGTNTRLFSVSELVRRAMSASSSSDLYECFEVESDYEPEPPCTIVNSRSVDVFDRSSGGGSKGVVRARAHAQRVRARCLAGAEDGGFFILGMVVLVRWIDRKGTFSTFHVKLLSEDGSNMNSCTLCRRRACGLRN